MISHVRINIQLLCLKRIFTRLNSLVLNLIYQCIHLLSFQGWEVDIFHSNIQNLIGRFRWRSYPNFFFLARVFEYPSLCSVWILLYITIGSNSAFSQFIFFLAHQKNRNFIRWRSFKQCSNRGSFIVISFKSYIVITLGKSEW